MNDVIAYIIVGAILIGAISMIFLIDKRTKNHGALFIKQATPLIRIFAILLGLFFLAISCFELTLGGEITFVFPILAVACIAYALGAEKLLKKLQR